MAPPATSLAEARYESVYRREGAALREALFEVWSFTRPVDTATWPNDLDVRNELEAAYSSSKPAPKDAAEEAAKRVRELYADYDEYDWQAVAAIHSTDQSGKAIRFPPTVRRNGPHSIEVSQSEVYDSQGNQKPDTALVDLAFTAGGVNPTTDARRWRYAWSVSVVLKGPDVAVITIDGARTIFKLARILTHVGKGRGPIDATPDLENVKHFGRWP